MKTNGVEMEKSDVKKMLWWYFFDSESILLLFSAIVMLGFSIKLIHWLYQLITFQFLFSY